MTIKRTSIAFAVLCSIPMLIAIVSGCGRPIVVGGVGGGGLGGVGIGKLYIANSATGTIVRFDTASTANGDIAPAATIAGFLTGLDLPRFIFLDVVNDRLYVANTGGNSILVFNNVSTKDGNVAPDRFLLGAATGLNGPFDVAVDVARNLMYVSNGNGNSILVFQNASTITGNAAPVRTITGANTMLGFIQGILLDAANNRLYAMNFATNSVVTFDNASTVDGNAIPDRVLSGAMTQLNGPVSARIDLLNNLIVGNSGGNSINLYQNATAIQGDTPPRRTLAGPDTLLSRPDQIFFDNSTGALYVANTSGNSVLVFDNISTTAVNIAPSRAISGAMTGLSRPTGIALDVSR